MADTADRRSLVVSMDRKDVLQRLKYRKLKALGWCVACKKVETACKRAYCYGCVDKRNATRPGDPAKKRIKS